MVYAAIHGTDTSVLTEMLSPHVFVLLPPLSCTTVTPGLKVLSLISCAVGTAPSTTGPAGLPGATNNSQRLPEGKLVLERDI